jgi:hypothetical protein
MLFTTTSCIGFSALLRWNVLYTLGAPRRTFLSNPLSNNTLHITTLRPLKPRHSSIWVTKHFRSTVRLLPHSSASRSVLLTTLPDDAVSNSRAEIAITVRGSDWYWTVTAIMMAATFAFIGLAATKPRQHRIFHYITASITMVASIAYFSMASNLGWVGIAVEFVRDDPEVSGLYREIFYGKTKSNRWWRCDIY